MPEPDTPVTHVSKPMGISTFILSKLFARAFEIEIHLLLGLVLFFGIHLELLAVSGWDTLAGDKILPSVTLGAAYAAYIARLSRGGMLETLNQDYVRTARAKGLSEYTVTKAWPGAADSDGTGLK